MFPIGCLGLGDPPPVGLVASSPGFAVADVVDAVGGCHLPVGDPPPVGLVASSPGFAVPDVVDAVGGCHLPVGLPLVLLDEPGLERRGLPPDSGQGLGLGLGFFHRLVLGHRLGECGWGLGFGLG